MARGQDNQQHVRRLTLPSGRRIDVVYFDDHRPDQSGDPDLHVCGTCHSDLVQPVDWEPAGRRHWQVTLRCPDCEWSGTGVFEQETVDRYDWELDRGAEILSRELDSLTLTNMADEVDRFINALADGHILPSDF